MKLSEQPEIVTVVASPPAGTQGSTDNIFIDAVLAALQRTGYSQNRVVRAASVRDIDLELGKILTDRVRSTIRLQFVGHSISGMLSLGATWLPECEVANRAFRYPYYVLDTSPSSLGLLAKYGGRISELMLVGCNIGSASSFGYAINGRTLTYTLAELLRCVVRGADDVVAPNELDGRGWYVPGPKHRRPKGWRYVEGQPPVWIDPGLDPVVGQGRAMTTRWFEIRAITVSLLPTPAAAPWLTVKPGAHISCNRVALEAPASALAEISIDTDQGPAQLLCGGKYLRWMDTCFVVEQTPGLSAALTETLWDDAVPALAEASAPDEPTQRSA